MSGEKNVEDEGAGIQDIGGRDRDVEQAKTLRRQQRRRGVIEREIDSEGWPHQAQQQKASSHYRIAVTAGNHGADIGNRHAIDASSAIRTAFAITGKASVVPGMDGSTLASTAWMRRQPNGRPRLSESSVSTGLDRIGNEEPQ